MSRLTLSVRDEAVEKLFRLIKAYSGLDAELDFLSGKVADAEATPADGTSISGLGTVARYVAGLSPAANQLLGSNPEQQAKIAEWVGFCLTELNPLMDDKLAKLNNWLLSRTVLVENSISLADLMIYSTVQPAVCAFPLAQHTHFCNLLRWYDYIHHVADKETIFPAATFRKPNLVAPKPVATQPKAASKAPAAPATSAPPPPAAAAASEEGGLSKGAAKKAAKKAEKKAAKAGAAGGDAAGAEQPATPATSAAPAAAPAPSTSSSATTAPAAAATEDVPPVDLLDLKVGTIVKVGAHPNADSLYVEEIDLGEEAPRQIVSGLRKFVTEEEMQNRRVIVVCNLKPAKMRDVMSYGMVLCASNEDHTVVQPVTPPEGVANGERVKFEGYGNDPETLLNPKRKQFEKIAPYLITNSEGVCTFKGIPFMTSKGPVTAALPNAHIK